jgi:hypothetical protein
LTSKSAATSAAMWQTASLSMLKPSESAAMWHTTSAGKWHPCQQPGGIQSASRWHPRRHPGGIHVSIQVSSHVTSVNSIPDYFILSRIVSHGLGCMGLRLLRDDSDTTRIVTFIKGTSRDLINDAHSTTKM